jgi:hypothetical protein
MAKFLTSMANGAARFWSRLLGPVPAWRMRGFEILFTLQFLAWMGMLYLHPMEWLSTEGFHVDLSDQRSTYWKAWPKFSPLGVLLFGVALFGGCGLILHGGRHKRTGFFLAALCAVYVLFADRASAFSISRLNVLVFLMLATAPPAYQDEEGRWFRHGGVQRLLMSLLIALYFTAGIAKVLHGDWLQHDDVIWTYMQGKYRTELAAWLLREMPDAFWVMQKWLALGFELGAPLWLGVPRLRPVGVVLGLGFHLLIALCFWTIWAFSLHCAVYYVLFVPQKWGDAVEGQCKKIRAL